MRQKELRIALVCYGGVSLAVYMHGVTKEIWQLARASRNFHAATAPAHRGVEGVYRELFESIETRAQLRLRVLPDILSGASAGGINAVFLAQAVHSGQSLEPLTDMWLKNADSDRLLDPQAQPLWRYAKFWAQPFVEWVLRQPGSAVRESVAPETRAEVRSKISRLVRGRWFDAPFSGAIFSDLLFDAFEAMGQSNAEAPLLPEGHPLDLAVTATDFRGHSEPLRLNSPPVVEESEHRLTIGFDSLTPRHASGSLADSLELTLAARATASFPGAFPPLRLEEIDTLAHQRGRAWPTREPFLERIMPAHMRKGTAQHVSLIDGSVLVNAPFGAAMEALGRRTAQREVDRRFVYIDPRPDRFGTLNQEVDKPVGFFAAILGSLSTIPREQPIRDNLEALEKQSQDVQQLKQIVAGLRPEVEAAVEKLFGRTLFLNRPTPSRLRNWRAKAQAAAVEQAGFAYHAYAQTKFASIIARLAAVTLAAAPQLGEQLDGQLDPELNSELGPGLRLPDPRPIEALFRESLKRGGLASLAEPKGGANRQAIAFFKAHDLGFRMRRLRLLVRRLSRDWENDPAISDEAMDHARAAIYEILSLYLAHDGPGTLCSQFAVKAANVLSDPEAVLDHLAAARQLENIDEEAEKRLARLLEDMPKALRRRMVLTYLGFPFYDIATLPLIRNEGLSEYDEIKIDRISPDDARTIREGGTRATLKGIEFYSFGAFFSRDYRENDYIWGRLHGAERMIDLLCSTLAQPLPEEVARDFKRRAFLAVIEEELSAGRCQQALLAELAAEIRQRLG